MGILYVRTIGSPVEDTVVSSLVITADAATPAGQVVVVFASHRSDTGAISVADSKGNTWQTDLESNVASRPHGKIFASRITNALAIGDTITITFPSTGRIMAQAIEIGPTTATGWADKTSSATGTDASAGCNSGATATTSQAAELLVGFAMQRGDVSDDGFADIADWTSVGSGVVGSSSTALWWHIAYRIVAATGAYAFNSPGDPSRAWASMIVTYKEGVAAVTTVLLPPVPVPRQVRQMIAY